jgi:ferrous iron transport protein B
MAGKNTIKVALVGNPNTGKTSLFNELTGLNQKVGNYPGITVEKKTGSFKTGDKVSVEVLDLPGTYSINPNTLDEDIVLKTLLHDREDDFPDVIVVVADVENIKRNLLLFSQIKDLQIPTILVLNMADQMKKKGISIDIEALKKELKAEVILISARKGDGIDAVKEAILNYKKVSTDPLAVISDRMDPGYFENIKKDFPEDPVYKSWLCITQLEHLKNISSEKRKKYLSYSRDADQLKKLQHKETILRYKQINDILKKTYKLDRTQGTDVRAKLDRVLTHKIWGYVIFALIIFLIFQSVFDWASVPMDYIDQAFTNFSAWTKSKLPPGMFTSLITEGIIPGIGGIVIFIPQIAILFLFVAILEETGYMSRVVFLMDKIMRKYGMSGKSVVPLISGTACAIPAIMAARNINGWKERLITILVTPFTTCSARLPVYAIIIALIIPDKRVLGIFSLQGLTLLSLYMVGFVAALTSGYLLHKVLKIRERSFFVIEMPNYKIPSLKNTFITVVEKTKSFVFGAGKIILAISVILWFLASNGSQNFKNAEEIVKNKPENTNASRNEIQQQIAAYKLENSYIGIMGKAIEPVIKPLGYDWKIGIALVSSFAAREVFVGTLATIYSVGNDDENNSTIKERMASEIDPETGKKQFTFPVGMSLLIFYAFAMQCMSTLAIVKRETNSWKWPLLQLFGMGALAYLASFITYSILS